MVSIIIVNYNTFDITCDCVKSVLQYTKGIPYEIILVDNASTKDNPDNFLEKFPSITLIKSPENGGFSKGNNLGIKHCTGDVILLLNSDTILTEDSISIAANYLDKHKDIGALGVKLVYPDGSIQHTARKFRSVRNELLDLLRPILFLMPYRYRSRIMLNQYFRSDYSVYCDWVIGAFMMFERTTLNKLPDAKLDERFFMYGEDQLWCYQLMKLGLKNYYLADTSVIHIYNASVEPGKRLKIQKRIISLELEIMLYRKGRGVYYFLFKSIFLAKELSRYYIKVFVLKIFNYRIK